MPWYTSEDWSYGRTCAQEYIARFGHGSAKLARQAQSKEKTLEKMVSPVIASHAHHLLLTCRSSSISVTPP